MVQRRKSDVRYTNMNCPRVMSGIFPATHIFCMLQSYKLNYLLIIKPQIIEVSGLQNLIFLW